MWYRNSHTRTRERGEAPRGRRDVTVPRDDPVYIPRERLVLHDEGGLAPAGALPREDARRNDTPAVVRVKLRHN